jgi:hypothetical protein
LQAADYKRDPDWRDPCVQATAIFSGSVMKEAPECTRKVVQSRCVSDWSQYTRNIPREHQLFPSPSAGCIGDPRPPYWSDVNCLRPVP